MKKIAGLVIALAFLLPSVGYAHQGGCRDSSPAGHCCHKDSSTGLVHCHFKRLGGS